VSLLNEDVAKLVERIVNNGLKNQPSIYIRCNSYGS